MFIPEGYTETEVIETIRGVARKLAYKFKFGHYDVEDFEQEAIIMIMNSQLLQKYNPNRPLENLLYTHLNRRFFNFKRDRYTKPNPPCVRCPLKAFIKPDKCTAYRDKEECKFYKRWLSSNSAKKNIMETIHVDMVRDASEENNMFYVSSLSSLVENRSIHQYLLTNLSLANRKLYLLLINNCKIKVNILNKLTQEIGSLMENYTEEVNYV